MILLHFVNMLMTLCCVYLIRHWLDQHNYKDVTIPSGLEHMNEEQLAQIQHHQAQCYAGWKKEMLWRTGWDTVLPSTKGV